MRAWSWIVPVAVILLLAGLNLQWVSQIRGGEAARMRLVARQRAEGLAQDFDNELGRAYDLFNTDPSTLKGEAWDDFMTEYDAWVAKAAHPRLFREWYVVHDDSGAGLVLQRFDPARKAFAVAPWTDELSPIRAAVEGENTMRPPGRSLPGVPHLGPEVGAPPSLLIPLFSSDVAVRAGYGPAYGYVIVLLDMAYLRSTFLPALARKYFGDASGLEYDVDVVSAENGAMRVFASNGDRERAAAADVEAPLFRIGFAHLDEMFLTYANNAEHEGIWLLRATHRDSSIETFVGRQRRRDVVLSMSVVGVLLASLVLLFVSARRARWLAAQQTAFVAGVSHELRTPLAVIRSAGENLADGMVAEPERVRLYGQLVANEGRRLSVLVEQAIRFAALETGAQAPPPEVYDIAPLVEEIAAQARPGVTREIAPRLPSLKGDPNATRQVICSLLENAHKHAPESPVAIRVDAIDWRGKPAVRVEIEDRGEGIDSSDLPHLFEPFYRGRRAQRGQIPGSGLGLSIVKRLVEQQRGAITVRSAPGKGSTFTICLPAA
jgi:signal transduction histidine kinase